MDCSWPELEDAMAVLFNKMFMDSCRDLSWFFMKANSTNTIPEVEQLPCEWLKLGGGLGTDGLTGDVEEDCVVGGAGGDSGSDAEGICGRTGG